MSDHEFEKQVRQKLNDLRLTPSAEAWEKIEQGLHERKKRRVPFFWLPVLLIGLGAGGYLIFDRTHSKDTRQMSGLHRMDENHDVIKNEQPPASQTGTPRPQPESVTIQPKANKSKPSPAHLNPVAANRPGATTLKNSNHNKAVDNTSTQVIPLQKNIAEHETPEGDATGTYEPPLQTIPTGRDVSAERSVNYYSAIPATARPATSSIRFNDLPKTEYAFMQSPAISNQKVNFTKKWAFGIHASGGISTVNEGNLLDFGRKAMVEDVAYRPAFMPTAAPTFTPSRITPSYYYSAGINVKRDLNKRFSLSASLNYLQLNTKNKVGQKVYANQVVNNGTRGYLSVFDYYTLEQDQASDYKNRYHFIELPVMLNTRLNKSKKLPLYWNAGLSYSRLLSSNSLHFDGTTGVYYKNDRLINQNQLSFITGFNVSVFNKKYPVWIGPTARYYLTRKLQKDVSANKNFLSAGLDVKLYLR